MRHIVVGVDGSPHAERALRWAVREAALLEASIDLVHGYVVHPRAGMVIHDQREPASATLDAIVERNRALLEEIEWTATLVPLLWSPADALVDPAGHADLVVVGSRGLGGFKELLLWSTSYRTAAYSAAPVAVIRADGEDLDGRRPIVVGIDDSRAARRALRWAHDEAQRRGVPLTAVHAFGPDTDWSLAAEATADERDRRHAELHERAVEMVDHAITQVGVAPETDVERVVVAGTAAGVLVDRAGADRLLVVGTRGPQCTWPGTAGLREPPVPASRHRPGRRRAVRPAPCRPARDVVAVSAAYDGMNTSAGVLA